MKFNFDNILLILTWTCMIVTCLFLWHIMKVYGTETAMATLFHF